MTLYDLRNSKKTISLVIQALALRIYCDPHGPRNMCPQMRQLETISTWVVKSTAWTVRFTLMV